MGMQIDSVATDVPPNIPKRPTRPALHFDFRQREIGPVSVSVPVADGRRAARMRFGLRIDPLTEGLSKRAAANVRDIAFDHLSLALGAGNKPEEIKVEEIVEDIIKKVLGNITDIESASGAM